MKVSGPKGISGGAPPAKRTSASGEGFSLPQVGPGDKPAPAAPVAGMSGVMGVEALLALQDVGDPLEGRRRSVRRASRLLDVLEDLKIALIDGVLTPDKVRALVKTLGEKRESTGDPILETVLDEIETRAAVELAKLEVNGLAS
ncbi:flagellar assembly regulator FliX [Phenylobacterium sp.]|uniref:flagellar assembly regulator FliX n=1 Tax=Phenylobacterium sp. TaxID=1871053 RepID=UPI0025CB87CF|nr:flagellar assembly protein FliX [Phenylobacterium sp.]MCA6289426.1 flagellar assembly protein FliX [Phenylobacterium sp.]MCA6343598.1 flagellar assembly protein FliX [Phenylobacterium sp.]